MSSDCDTAEVTRREVVEEIIRLIKDEKREIKNRGLIGLCQKYVQMQNGETDPHIYHEIAETALNSVIKNSLAECLTASTEPVKTVAEIIKPLAACLPTQTWRSREQAIRQQFSTPPAVAYLLVYLLNLRLGEKVLEPSAGTGSLAVWSAGIGLETNTNEIDSRWGELLRLIGFTPTAFDAEFINDYLAPETRIDCVLMNPPFSANGGRTKNNSSKYGFRHVESALERLNKDGKFGIILGEAAGLETRTGREFWGKFSDRVEVKAIIKINGHEYYKNGTSVGINLITGKKRREMINSDWRNSINQITCIKAETVEKVFELTEKLALRLI